MSCTSNSNPGNVNSSHSNPGNIANELELVGSHGMQAHEYDRMLQMILSGKLQPGKLIGQTVSLERAAATLGRPEDLRIAGISVIDQI